eukprot:COSAG01_NODE_60891_length_292_cov_0.803109_1_plen_27_part_01
MRQDQGQGCCGTIIIQLERPGAPPSKV